MRITILDGDDWVAIYRDGQRVYQGHSCPLGMGLAYLGIDYETRDVKPSNSHNGEPEWTGDEFPETL